MMGAISGGFSSTNDALSILAILGDPKKADATLRQWKAEADRAEAALAAAKAENESAVTARQSAERMLDVANRTAAETAQTILTRESDLRIREATLASNIKAFDQRVAVFVSAEALSVQAQNALDNARRHEQEAAAKNSKAQETLNQADQLKAAYLAKLSKLKQIAD